MVLVLVSARLWITRNRICFRICLLLSSEAVTGGFLPGDDYRILSSYSRQSKFPK